MHVHWKLIVKRTVCCHTNQIAQDKQTFMVITGSQLADVLVPKLTLLVADNVNNTYSY